MNSNSENDSFDDVKTALLFIAVFALAVWALFHWHGDKMVYILFKLSITPFYYFSEHLPPLLLPPNAALNYFDIAQKMSRAYLGQHGVEAAFKVILMWGWAARYFLLPFLLWRLTQVIVPPVTFLYKRRLTPDKLKREIAKEFPYSTVFLNLDIVKMNAFDGKLRIADDFINFSGKHGLLIHQNKRIPIFSATECEMDVPKKRKLLPPSNHVFFDIAKCDALMRAQLGDLWVDVHTLDRPVKILTISFMLMACGGNHIKKGRQLLEMLARKSTAKHSKEDINTVILYQKLWALNRTANKYYKAIKDDTALNDLMSRHQYAHTVIIALLVEARKKYGKVPPCEFIWLRLQNRTLWYTLHAIGGNVPWTEGGGAYAHYYTEVEVGAGVKEACHQAATVALMDALKIEQWINLDQQYDTEVLINDD